MHEGLVSIFLASIFSNNIVLNQFLGLCPFMGVSKKVETSIGMSFAVLFVMLMASIVTYFLQYLILIPYHLEYLQTIVFILVIAGLVQFVEMFMQKFFPALYQALGIYLPLITTNCAVLGVAILNIRKHYNFVQMVVHTTGIALGFGLALVILASLRERLEFSNVPKAMQGAPIGFITAGLLALAFSGFAGLF